MRPCFHCLIPFLLLLVSAQAALAGVVTGKVVAIADGDTITVLENEVQVKVRLHGVDATESGQDFGTAAREFTADACFGETVNVVVTDTDRYGRKVGVVVLKDGRVLNHELVAAGLAHWYADYAPRDEALKRLQEEAKAAKRGLWSRPDVVTPGEFRRGNGGAGIAPSNPPGDVPVVKPGPKTDDGGEVFLSNSGKKYHRKDCHTLKGGKRAVTRSVAEREGFGRCGVCKP